FVSGRRRHTTWPRDWSSDVCSSDLGILILQALRAAGCSRVFVTDVDSVRLDLARQVGATAVLLSDDTLSTHLLELTNGEGVDVEIGRASCRERGQSRGAPVGRGRTP